MAPTRDAPTAPTTAGPGPNGNGAGSTVAPAPTRAGTGVLPSAKPDAAYRGGPAAEAGAQQPPDLGGSYRVSGASTLGGLR